jgi:outer membrane murein-binding lipoprotein Lpp
MDVRRRAEQVAELDASIARLRSDIERLAGIVGDPEDVVDERGWLPRDRREIMLVYYRLDRESEVKELRVKIPALKAALKAATARDERSKVRVEVDLAKA